jgi:hypothetical protein
MPLKLNVGLSRKVGLPGYGSLGASCSLEVELPSMMLSNDVEGLQRQIRNAYASCSQAIKDELARQQQKPSVTDAAPAAGPDGNGHGTPPAGNGRSNGHSEENSRISQKQLDYVRQLAGQIKGLGLRRLDGLTGKMFGKPLADLSAVEASALIDVLKDVQTGKIELKAAVKERSDESQSR